MNERVMLLREDTWRLLRYFGFIWGAILFFLIQNRGTNSLALIISDFIVDVVSSSKDPINFMGVCVLLLMVALVIFSLLSFLRFALVIDPFNEKTSQKDINKMSLFIQKLSLANILGLVLFVVFSTLALLKNTFPSSVIPIGKLFFWIVFSSLTFVDSWLWIKREGDKLGYVINLVLSWFLGFFYFLWTLGITGLKSIAPVFLFLLVIYILIRILLIAKLPFLIFDKMFSWLDYK